MRLTTHVICTVDLIQIRYRHIRQKWNLRRRAAAHELPETCSVTSAMLKLLQSIDGDVKKRSSALVTAKMAADIHSAKTLQKSILIIMIEILVITQQVMTSVTRRLKLTSSYTFRFNMILT